MQPGYVLIISGLHCDRLLQGVVSSSTCMDPQLSRLGHTMPHDYARGETWSMEFGCCNSGAFQITDVNPASERGDDTSAPVVSAVLTPLWPLSRLRTSSRAIGDLEAKLAKRCMFSWQLPHETCHTAPRAISSFQLNSRRRR